MLLLAAGVYGFAAVLAGALLHIAIDVSAIRASHSWPRSPTGNIPWESCPGPSLLLAVAAFGVVVVTMLSLLPFSSAMVLYGITVVLYIAVRTGIFLIVAAILPGRKIPSINPFRWLVILEDESSYVIRQYTLFRGSPDEVFEKFKNTDARETGLAFQIPEVRRFLFFSYIVTAERTGTS